MVDITHFIQHIEKYYCLLHGGDQSSVHIYYYQTVWRSPKIDIIVRFYSPLPRSNYDPWDQGETFPCKKHMEFSNGMFSLNVG